MSETALSPIGEIAVHLAKMVTPKDSVGYWRLLKDNEGYLVTELTRAMQQAREQALTQAEETYAEAHSWDYFKEAALAIRALKNKGA